MSHWRGPACCKQSLEPGPRSSPPLRGEEKPGQLGYRSHHRTIHASDSVEAKEGYLNRADQDRPGQMRVKPRQRVATGDNEWLITNLTFKLLISAIKLCRSQKDPGNLGIFTLAFPTFLASASRFDRLVETFLPKAVGLRKLRWDPPTDRGPRTSSLPSR